MWLIWRASCAVACRGVAAVLATLWVMITATTSYGSTFSTDFSDLWWNAAESGWGVNVAHQGDTLFLTFFVYGADGLPTWYSGSDTRFVGEAGGVLTYAGQLHDTRGILGAGSTSTRLVGTVTMAFDTINTATLTYTINGATTTKRVTRYTFRTNDLTGSYIGALVGTYSGCSAGNGYQEEASPVNISHNGTSITITSGSCVFQGAYSQSGRMGTIAGTSACGGGASGSFAAFEVEGTISGMTARAVANLGGSCRWEGRLGGLRRQ